MIRVLTDGDVVVEVPPTIGEYDFHKVIGTGNSSIVVLASNRKTQRKSACKVVPRSILSDERKMSSLTTEIQNLQSIHHPNIIEVHDILFGDDNIYIFLEYCAHGELLNYVIEHEKMPLPMVKKFFCQLCSAVRFLHENGIAHRDLKPENVFLDENLNVKLGDLGFSKRADRNTLMETPCGSPYYVAPEVLAGDGYDGRKSDIWSLGVLLFGLATGTLPWTAQNQTHLFYQISEAQYTIPPCVDRQVAACVEQCLRVDPGARPTAAQLLRTPLLRDAAQTGTKPKANSPKIAATSLIVKAKQGAMVKPVIAKSGIFRKLVSQNAKPKVQAASVKPGVSLGALDQYRIDNVPETWA